MSYLIKMSCAHYNIMIVSIALENATDMLHSLRDEINIAQVYLRDHPICSLVSDIVMHVP